MPNDSMQHDIKNTDNMTNITTSTTIDVHYRVSRYGQRMDRDDENTNNEIMK